MEHFVFRIRIRGVVNRIRGFVKEEDGEKIVMKQMSNSPAMRKANRRGVCRNKRTIKTNENV